MRVNFASDWMCPNRLDRRSPACVIGSQPALVAPQTRAIMRACAMMASLGAAPVPVLPTATATRARFVFVGAGALVELLVALALDSSVSNSLAFEFRARRCFA